MPQLWAQRLLAPPSPQAMLRFAYATQQVQGIYVFQHCLGEGGGAWEWGTGDLGAYRLFFKSSKDLLHYSMLFLEMSQVFLTSIVELGILLEETSICISSLDKQDLVENGKCILGYYSIIVCARSEIWRGNTLFSLK